MQLASVAPSVAPPSARPSIPSRTAEGRRAAERPASTVDVVVEPRRRARSLASPDAPLAGRTLHDLAAWQGAMELAVACHRLTRDLPAEATELATSIRQAAADVAAHVALGHDRLLASDFADHLAVARGALSRLATHLEIARRLRFVDDAAAGAIADRSAEVARRIGRLVRALYGIGRSRTSSVRGAGERDGDRARGAAER